MQYEDVQLLKGNVAGGRGGGENPQKSWWNKWKGQTMEQVWVIGEFKEIKQTGNRLCQLTWRWTEEFWVNYFSCMRAIQEGSGNDPDVAHRKNKKQKEIKSQIIWTEIIHDTHIVSLIYNTLHFHLYLYFKTNNHISVIQSGAKISGL